MQPCSRGRAVTLVCSACPWRRGAGEAGRQPILHLLSQRFACPLDHCESPAHPILTDPDLDQSSKQLEHRKQELSDLITEVLRRHPSLCYFQGYHDIVQVLLLVLGVDRAPPAVARLSLLRIRDFMLPSLSAATDQLRLLPSVLSVADPILWRHLQTTRPFFALSATLTLYAHDIQEYGAIARLFDFLLAREAVMSIYLFATVGMIELCVCKSLSC